MNDFELDFKDDPFNRYKNIPPMKRTGQRNPIKQTQK